VLAAIQFRSRRGAMAPSCVGEHCARALIAITLARASADAQIYAFLLARWDTRPRDEVERNTPNSARG